MVLQRLTTREQVNEQRGTIQPDGFEWRRLAVITTVFLGFMLLFSLHRHFTYYTSYDHGAFNQIFWNSLHGRLFESSLISGNSVSVLADRELPIVNFVHLGQHFVPTFLLWLPFYALAPHPATLIVLQVVLMAAGGVVLYFLARHYLQPNLSVLITASYFGAIAVICPTFANFYEHCQFPLFVFGMLLAMEKQRWWIFWVMVLLVLGIREDAGITLFGIGLFLLLSRRQPKLGAILCGLSFAYVTIVTSGVITQFSADNPRLYMTDRFQRFVPGNDSPTTLQVLWGMVTHPIELVQAVLVPFDRRFFYLIGHWLPLALIPAISPASWIMSGVPLLPVFTQSKQIALEISVRYAVAIVPGVFYGTILWWAHSSHRLSIKLEGLTRWQQMAWSLRQRRLTPTFKKFWGICLVISVVYAIVTNPNQAFYFLVPDSIQPWVMVPLTTQWQRTAIMNDMVRQIPADATVSATTHLIPHLSGRRKITRLPHLLLKDENGQVEPMEYVMADLWRLEQYMPIFKNDRNRLQAFIPLIDKLIQEQTYGIVKLQDKIILLQKGAASHPETLAMWKQVKQDLLAKLETISVGTS